MASNGIRRKVDDLGRVVIPASIRRSLGIREGDAVEVTVEGERVVIARPQDACVFCAREDAPLASFRGRRVCGDCAASISEVAGSHAAPAAPPPAPRSAPQGFPDGPIDGDAMARQAAAQQAAAREAGRVAARRNEDLRTRRPRADHDPASTTSW